MTVDCSFLPPHTGGAVLKHHWPLPYILVEPSLLTTYWLLLPCLPIASSMFIKDGSAAFPCAPPTNRTLLACQSYLPNSSPYLPQVWLPVVPSLVAVYWFRLPRLSVAPSLLIGRTFLAHQPHLLCLPVAPSLLMLHWLRLPRRKHFPYKPVAPSLHASRTFPAYGRAFPTWPSRLPYLSVAPPSSIDRTFPHDGSRFSCLHIAPSLLNSRALLPCHRPFPVFASESHLSNCWL